MTPEAAASPTPDWECRYKELRDWAEQNGWLDKALRSFDAAPLPPPEPRQELEQVRKVLNAELKIASERVLTLELEVQALRRGLAPSARVLALARIGASLEHYRVFRYDYTGKNHQGHVNQFETCPHPDCVAVRSLGDPSQAT